MGWTGGTQESNKRVRGRSNERRNGFQILLFGMVRIFLTRHSALRATILLFMVAVVVGIVVGIVAVAVVVIITSELLSRIFANASSRKTERER